MDSVILIPHKLSVAEALAKLVDSLCFKLVMGFTAYLDKLNRYAMYLKT